MIDVGAAAYESFGTSQAGVHMLSVCRHNLVEFPSVEKVKSGSRSEIIVIGNLS